MSGHLTFEQAWLVSLNRYNSGMSYFIEWFKKYAKQNNLKADARFDLLPVAFQTGVLMEFFLNHPDICPETDASKEIKQTLENWPKKFIELMEITDDAILSNQIEED